MVSEIALKVISLRTPKDLSTDAANQYKTELENPGLTCKVLLGNSLILQREDWRH